jgi:hypothetical protein
MGSCRSSSSLVDVGTKPTNSCRGSEIEVYVMRRRVEDRFEYQLYVGYMSFSTTATRIPLRRGKLISVHIYKNSHRASLFLVIVA